MTRLGDRIVGPRFAVLLTLLVPAAASQAQVPSPPVQAPRPDETKILAKGEVVVGTPLSVGLVANSSRIWLRVMDDKGASSDAPISVQSALMMLANRRFSFLWDALVAWAGEDLSRLRDAQVAWTGDALRAATPAMRSRDTGESLVEPEVAAAAQHAEALVAAGRGEEAIGVLRARLPAELRRERQKMEFTVLTLKIASVMRHLDDKAGAFEMLSAGARQLGKSDYRTNMLVNRAAHLAADGRYAEALRDVDAATAAFAAGPADLQVPGSYRQFAWIRACALAGLGRTSEARALAASVLASEQPSAPDLILESNDSIRRRMQTCMGDKEGLISDLIKTTESSPFSGLPFLLQTGFDPPHFRPDLLAAVRSNPEVRRVAAEHLRPLPATMLPALRSWRNAPAH